ncbi:hypothetical protein JCGZ_04631 [Jatropha curcas]|uniref:Protein TIFY n=1 Tax=Jatropha curcas TaxID=180498 RepID=A0A067KSK4_JATCU|nr:protein TIFY 5A [Jatropha curcas]KDP37988.1 hypothetical protein JCGZ_04631 [Jatropha curcas]
MRRNCNLELRLFPFPDSDDDHRRYFVDESNKSPQDEEQQQRKLQQEQQKLTIFYNGNICVCDVTELQARNILMLASREMDDKIRSASGSPEPTSPTLSSPVYSPNNGLSMKRSLQRFLQKRNHRIQATYPYNINGRREYRLDG